MVVDNDVKRKPLERKSKVYSHKTCHDIQTLADVERCRCVRSLSYGSDFIRTDVMDHLGLVKMTELKMMVSCMASSGIRLKKQSTKKHMLEVE